MEAAYLLLDMASNLVHFAVGKGVVFAEDTLVLSDTVDKVPQRAVAGYSGKVPVDIRTLAHKVVEVQMCCLEGTEKL